MTDATIVFTGAANTGKSTLMKMYSERNNVPIVQFETKPIMKEFGLETHSDIIKLMATDIRKGIKFQEALIYGRIALFDSTERPFVSDRLPFDSYIYYLIQFAWADDPNNTMKLYELCTQHMETIEYVGILPWNSLPLTAFKFDGKRVMNPMWHEMFGQAHQTVLLKYESMRTGTPTTGTMLHLEAFGDTPEMENDDRIHFIETVLDVHQEQSKKALDEFRGTLQ